MVRTTELMIPAPQGPVRIRVLNPFDNGLRPALVYLHGGGWTIFSIDTHDRLMREYAGRAGIVVIGVDYSMSPESRFPRAIDETVAVVRWLEEHGTDVGVDPDRIAVGFSGYVNSLLRDFGIFVPAELPPESTAASVIKITMSLQKSNHEERLTFTIP